MAEFLAEFHFTIHHVAGKMNPADPLTRRSESELWAELGCLEFALDLHPEEAQIIENGYADDQEMATESVNSAPFKRGETKVQNFGKEKCNTLRQY